MIVCEEIQSMAMGVEEDIGSEATMFLKKVVRGGPSKEMSD